MVSLVLATNGSLSYSEIMAMKIDEFVNLMQEVSIFYTAEKKGAGSVDEQVKKIMTDPAIPNKRF